MQGIRSIRATRRLLFACLLALAVMPGCDDEGGFVDTGDTADTGDNGDTTPTCNESIGVIVLSGGNFGDCVLTDSVGNQTCLAQVCEYLVAGVGIEWVGASDQTPTLIQGTSGSLPPAGADFAIQPIDADCSAADTETGNFIVTVTEQGTSDVICEESIAYDVTIEP